MEQLILSLFNLFAPIFADLYKKRRDGGTLAPTEEELLTDFQANLARGRYEGDQWKLFKGRL